MMRFTVRPDGAEPFEIDVTTRDVLRWERTTSGASMTMLAKNLTAGMMYQLAYLCTQRLGLFNGSRDMFEERCDIEPLTDDDESDADGAGESDPTQAAH